MSKIGKNTKVVRELVAELREGESKRFKQSELEVLFFAVLSDETHEGKNLKYDIKNKSKSSEPVNYNKMFKNFLDGVFKSAGVKAEERESLIAAYEPKAKDLAFFMDAVEEAEMLYIESGKTLKKWANHEINLLLKKYERKGKYEGETTISRKLIDREKAIKVVKAAKA